MVNATRPPSIFRSLMKPRLTMSRCRSGSLDDLQRLEHGCRFKLHTLKSIATANEPSCPSSRRSSIHERVAAERACRRAAAADRRRRASARPAATSGGGGASGRPTHDVRDAPDDRDDGQRGERAAAVRPAANWPPPPADVARATRAPTPSASVDSADERWSARPRSTNRDADEVDVERHTGYTPRSESATATRTSTRTDGARAS